MQLFASPELLLHEYCLVLQQCKTGRLTRSRHLIESRRGGCRNRFEVEAREFATRHAGQLQDLSCATPPHSPPSPKRLTHS